MRGAVPCGFDMCNEQETDMDFIEQLFGISPDGGDGSLEYLWLAAFMAVGAAVYGWRRRQARSR
jgi:hypothetical protein